MKMMTKRKFNYKRLIKRAFSYMTSALEEGRGLMQIKEDLRNIVNSYSGLNRDERYDIYWSCYKVCRAAKKSDNWKKVIGLGRSYDTVVSSVRRVKGSYDLRSKRRATREQLKSGTVFFVCSSHDKCADDHKDYQGKIYVDRFWRLKVKGSQYYAVQSYIKNKGVRTVQEIMKGPVWLTTRPYCKHFFIGVDVDTVLHNSVKKIVEEVGKGYESGYDYYELRNEVYERLNQITPCKEFQKK